MPMSEAFPGCPALIYEGPTALLTLDRPEKRNALSFAVWRSLPLLIRQAAARRETRAIILSGRGGNFAAGADIGEFDTVMRNRTEARVYVQVMAAATAAIEACPLPVIAMIEGFCIGAGVALALSCDMRLAASDARFAVTPAKLGLIYPFADSKRLVHAIGASHAKDLLFTGRTIDAERALAIGLVDEVAEASKLAEAVAERAALIAEASSWSIMSTKRMLCQILDLAGQESRQTIELFADGPGGPHYQEGLAAFKARRKPKFPPR